MPAPPTAGRRAAGPAAAPAFAAGGGGVEGASFLSCTTGAEAFVPALSLSVTLFGAASFGAASSACAAVTKNIIPLAIPALAAPPRTSKERIRVRIQLLS